MTRTPTISLASINLKWLLQQQDLVSIPSLGAQPHTLDTDVLLSGQLNPSELDAALAQLKSHFLGTYVEALWLYYLRKSKRYRLIANGLQVNIEGKTVGEFDFVVEDLLASHDQDRFIHQELAIKFYLALPVSDQKKPYWFGSNHIDRLDLKARHLKEHQLRLSSVPEAQQLLDELGAPNVTRECIIRGRLFFPYDKKLRRLCHNYESDTKHITKGTWYTLSEFINVNRDNTSSNYFILDKVNWMSFEIAEEMAVAYSEAVEQLQNLVGNKKRGVMVKTSKQHQSQRHDDIAFVVHDNWSKACYDSLVESLE